MMRAIQLNHFPSGQGEANANSRSVVTQNKGRSSADLRSPRAFGHELV